MAINFRGGPPKPPTTRPTDPIKIFQARPSLDSQVTDLWRGQARALEQWYSATENDILISLNTGAGKSILGTLICQSWLNAGVENPVYLCATNDLVEQTAKEASKLALKFTTRMYGDYSNDLFESGEGFLITSYQTLFNARTRLRAASAPGAILFDDAHVGEPTLRSQFTLTIEKVAHPEVYQPLISAIESNLGETDRQSLRFVLTSRTQGDVFLCPPMMGAALNDLLASLASHFDGEGKSSIFFPYSLLATHFDACAVVVRTDRIELSPPFLPVRSTPAMQRADVKRVYLSATLKAESEFVRAYGRRPGLIIEPEVDAGNGERTIITTRDLADREQLVAWAQRQSTASKVLVAVPDAARAQLWNSVARPAEPAHFNKELKAFREARAGGFILAGRFDGIDLPDATCRLMVIAGLPSGGSALETYLWQNFEMQNLLAARVATRVTQLFGRIIRGRNDYGMFVLQGTDLVTWVSRDRNLALLPDLLQRQFKLGRALAGEFEINSLPKLSDFYQQILDREETWLEYYRDYIDGLELDRRDVERRNANEAIQLASAISEAKFIEAMWQHRYGDAAAAIEPVIDSTSTEDARLAGWLNLWAGCARLLSGNTDGARDHFRIARSRLPLHMELPIDAPAAEHSVEVGAAAEAALRALIRTSSRTFTQQQRAAVAAATLSAARSTPPSACEEAYRAVGASLGFRATRPDQEFATGPDVLWIDEFSREAISFELKTDKAAGSSLSKREIGQSHNHIQWVADKHPDVRHIQHFMVGYSLNVASNASPAPQWQHSEPSDLLNLIQAFMAEAERIRNYDHGRQALECERMHRESKWSTEHIRAQLSNRPVL